MYVCMYVCIYIYIYIYIYICHTDVANADRISSNSWSIANVNRYDGIGRYPKLNFYNFETRTRYSVSRFKEKFTYML